MAYCGQAPTTKIQNFSIGIEKCCLDPVAGRGDCVGHSFEPDEVAAVTEYVLKLSGQAYDATKIAAGQDTFDATHRFRWPPDPYQNS